MGKHKLKMTIMVKRLFFLGMLLLSGFAAQPSFAQLMRIDLLLEQNSLHIHNQKTASLSYVEYGIVKPGEMFLGPDRKPGTVDDFLFDTNSLDALEHAYKWEFDLLFATTNIADSSYNPTTIYQGFGYYDGGGISSWLVSGILSFDSFEAGYGMVGSPLFIPGLGFEYSEWSVVLSSTRPYTTAPIPEPNSVLLVGLGVIFLAKRRKKPVISTHSNSKYLLQHSRLL